ncbi:MAG TPA: hypothetical protein VI217_17260 [Mycobacterium sp.]|jgi:hypothetical protein
MEQTRIRALVAAGAITLGALLTVATPAVAHAAFDKKSFDNCARAAENRFIRGETDNQTLDDEYKFCCARSGGFWNLKKSSCDAEPPARTAEPQVPQAPRPTEASTLP